MRSIRRSLLGYLLLLVALAIGAVGILVDRFANGAVRTREVSETERIKQNFKARQQEAKTKFDAELMAEGKSLARELQRAMTNILGQNWELPRRISRTEFTALQVGAAMVGTRVDSGQPQPPLKATEEEGRLYRTRVALMEIAAPPHALPTAMTLAALEPRIPSGLFFDQRTFNDQRRYSPYPGWVEYDTPRLLARIQEWMRKTFDDDDHPGGFQITYVATTPGRTSHTVTVASPVRVGTERVELPLDPIWFEQDSDREPTLDDVTVPGIGQFRRVVTANTAGGRNLSFNIWMPPPTIGNVPSRPVSRGPHLSLRVYIHAIRPYSELDARLKVDQQDHDEQLARVGEETRTELAQLRQRLWVIGGVTFAALVLGGWFFVARGLSPLRKLSDAVSRVSEKDFLLPVEADTLGRELVPIHARITQTLTLLQRAFAREKQSVADISHELRTPIASLLATIDVALRKPRTPEQYRVTLEECRLISKQLGQLVERIMTLASLDAGNDYIQFAHTDASELAASCAAVIRPLATANNITVTLLCDEELILDTDAGKLREVLMNLLHNAVEYNQPGGTIELTVRSEGSSAIFEVRDTGIGMTADVKERIFERFYRADPSRQATGVHAGLGLAIVKEYVARLNGTIAVESQPGVSTTFRITLPAATDEPLIAIARTKPRRDPVPTAS